MPESPFKYTNVEGIGTCISIPLSDTYVQSMYVRSDVCILRLTQEAFLELIFETVAEWDKYGRKNDLYEFQKNTQRITLVDAKPSSEVIFKLGMRSFDGCDVVHIHKTDKGDIFIEIFAEIAIYRILRVFKENEYKVPILGLLDREKINALRTRLSIAQSLEVT